MPEASLRMLQGDELEIEIRGWRTTTGSGLFDLEFGPLLRFELLNVNDCTNILLVCMHHIVTDGWSQNIFVRELTVLYDAYSNNCPSPLPELPVQYADFAAWQRKWLQGQVLEGLLEYWKTNLAGPV